MNRKKKEERTLREDGKAFEASKIEIQTVYRNPKYTLVEHPANTITSTGLLKVFDLQCSEAGPSFSARWDGGSRSPGKKERHDLDIDIVGVSKAGQRRFKHSKGGYSGHHAVDVSSPKGREYHVCLGKADGLIFEGNVRFNLLRKMRFNAGMRQHQETLKTVLGQ